MGENFPSDNFQRSGDGQEQPGTADHKHLLTDHYQCDPLCKSRKRDPFQTNWSTTLYTKKDN